MAREGGEPPGVVRPHFGELSSVETCWVCRAVPRLPEPVRQPRDGIGGRDNDLFGIEVEKVAEVRHRPRSGTMHQRGGPRRRFLGQFHDNGGGVEDGVQSRQPIAFRIDRMKIDEDPKRDVAMKDGG